MTRIAAVFLFLLALCANAAAAELSASYTDWSVNGRVVRLGVTLPYAAAAHIGTRSSVQAVTQYVLKRVGAASGAGACTAIDQGYDIGTINVLAPAPDAYRFEIFFDCPSASGMVLKNGLLFDTVWPHVDFARVRIGSRAPVQIVFRRDLQSIALAPPAMITGSGVWDYVPVGAAFALSSWIAISFLFALILVLRGRQSVAAALVALACGYAASVVLALGGWFAPDPQVAEALWGLPVLLVVIQYLVTRTGRVGTIALVSVLIVAAIALVPLFQQRWMISLTIAGVAAILGGYTAILGHRAAGFESYQTPSFLFGFLEGLCFVPAVIALPSPIWSVWRIPVGLGLGAFLSAALIILGGFCVAWLLARRPWRMAPVLQDWAIAVSAGLGLFWLSSVFWA